MQRQCITRTQMTMIMANDFVCLQVPALHLLVFTAREQIRMAITHAYASDRTHVTRQRELEAARRQIPYLYNAIAGTCREPLVARIDVHASDPAEMTADHAIQFPWRVPLRLRHCDQTALVCERVLLIAKYANCF